MQTDQLNTPILHVVHCIDTEGPLDEDIDATFKRIEGLFGVRLPVSAETLTALAAPGYPPRWSGT